MIKRWEKLSVLNSGVSFFMDSSNKLTHFEIFLFFHHLALYIIYILGNFFGDQKELERSWIPSILTRMLSFIFLLILQKTYSLRSESGAKKSPDHKTCSFPGTHRLWKLSEWMRAWTSLLNSDETRLLDQQVAFYKQLVEWQGE